jgi:hypothetical protein
MREPILAWCPQPLPGGTVYFARHLADADTVAEVFGRACAGGGARLTPEGWQHLWATYGLAGLTNIARRGDCSGTGDETRIADELIRRSMLAGYDPVSGFFGHYCEEHNTFELAGR